MCRNCEGLLTRLGCCAVALRAGGCRRGAASLARADPRRGRRSEAGNRCRRARARASPPRRVTRYPRPLRSQRGVHLEGAIDGARADARPGTARGPSISTCGLRLASRSDCGDLGGQRAGGVRRRDVGDQRRLQPLAEVDAADSVVMLAASLRRGCAASVRRVSAGTIAAPQMACVPAARSTRRTRSRLVAALSPGLVWFGQVGHARAPAAARPARRCARR